MGSSADVQQQIDGEMREFKEKIQRDLDNNADRPTKLSDLAKKKEYKSVLCKIAPRRILRGHTGKVYAVDWGSDSKHLATAAQDGRIIVWNGFTANKVHAIALRSNWVMGCAYSPSRTLIAAGGLDTNVNLFKLPDVSTPETATTDKPWATLSEHTGFMSSCKFLSDDELVSASGDTTCILWDTATKTPKTVYRDHQGEIMSVSAFPSQNIFVSGSCDATSKLWDTRAPRVVHTFVGHETDVNTVSFFPDGTAFASGSDDSTCRLFDLRAFSSLALYANERITCGVTSLAFSKTGKLLFAGYDDFNVYGWDSLIADVVHSMSSHENRVSSIAVSPDGKAVATGSWDYHTKIWA